MITYWLIGEKGNSRHQRGAKALNWPKSSLRNSNKLREYHNSELTSSLDSPKKLRFAGDEEEAEGRPRRVLAEILDETLTSKRNSCPNLKVVSGGGVICNSISLPLNTERKGTYKQIESHPLASSTTSLVEALTMSQVKAVPLNGRRFSLKRNHGEMPKIELSPPEESAARCNDYWPLLDPKFIGENDTETNV